MGSSAAKVIEDIRDEWLRSSKGIAGQSVGRALHILSRLTFIEPGQFILEFLQNAEDARMELGKRGGRFKVEISRGTVIIEHDGKPFDIKDLRNLCSISRSKKPSKGYKGYIGIGWKSVFKVSSHVEVYSGDYAFMFSKRYWHEHADDLKGYGLKPEEVLWQVTPIPIRPTEYIGDKTRYVIYLDSSEYYEAIRRAVDELRPHLFMFLDYIGEIEIVDSVRDLHRLIKWRVEDRETLGDTKVQLATLYYEEGPLRDEKGGRRSYEEYLVFRKAFDVPDDVRSDPGTVDADRGDVVRREVSIAFALEGGKVRPFEGGQFWGVYSFLPLHEVRSGLKFLIQGDFIVHPGRRSINYEAKWNYWLMGSIAEVVREAIKYLAKNYRESYLKVFEYEAVTGDLFYLRMVEPTVIRVINQELEDPEVICINGHTVKLSKTVRFHPSVKELIKRGLISEEDLKLIYGDERHFLDPKVELRRRDEDKVAKFSLTDVLNVGLIQHRLKKSVDEAVELLAEVYRAAYSNNVYIPSDKRLVITRSGAVKAAAEAYLSEVPEKVRELMDKFEDVRRFVESLNFVHDGLAKRLGEDILKWIGVRKLEFKEVVERVLLPKIYTDSLPPSRDELLVITSIAKQAGITPSKPIWAITIKGGVRSTAGIYYPYPYHLLESLDLLISLGVDFLDINAYLKYDMDVDGWRRFFESAQVKGSNVCRYSSYLGTYFMDPDYHIEIINKIIERLYATTDKDLNIRYMRILKQIYGIARSCWPESQRRVRVLTDEGRFIDSGACLLHDAYDPEERWVRWRDQGFKIGPFISPDYIDKVEDKAIWKEFLVRRLGVKAGASREDIERFAEWLTESRLVQRGFKIMSRGGKGYDMLVEDNRGDIYYVEVKGRRKLSEEGVELTQEETRAAMDHRDKYWLVVVFDIPNDPKVKVVKDPISYIGSVKISSELILNGMDL